jgi:hypothetical protein
MNHELASPAGAGIRVAYAPASTIQLGHLMHGCTYMHIVYLLEQ